MTRRRSTRKRLPKSKISLLLLVIALIIGYFAGIKPAELLRMLEQNPSATSTAKTKSKPVRKPESKAKSGTTTTAADRENSSADLHGFTRLDGATLARWGGNDGDSFKVHHNGDTYVFRLYFVDTPESTFRFPNRVGHQARYFKTSREKAIGVGKNAKKFTTAKLTGNEFTVFTRWESVMGSDRFHAFIVTPGGKFLCEELVSHGLARIYTMPADLPDGTSKKKFNRHLTQLESTAREQRLGGWR